MGELIPVHEVRFLHLKENQQVVVDILPADNPLKELFGFGQKNRITKEEFLETRALLESAE